MRQFQRVPQAQCGARQQSEPGNRASFTTGWTGTSKTFSLPEGREVTAMGTWLKLGQEHQPGAATQGAPVTSPTLRNGGQQNSLRELRRTPGKDAQRADYASATHAQQQLQVTTKFPSRRKQKGTLLFLFWVRVMTPTRTHACCCVGVGGAKVSPGVQHRLVTGTAGATLASSPAAL